jgi:CRISPR-associated protein Csx10
MTLTIDLKSYSLPASGEGDALIDADVLFHKTGFPYINGRRLRGLLKESINEVLEIMDEQSKDSLLEKLFGKEGYNADKGCIRISNAFPENWDYIKKQVNGNPDLKNPRLIKEYFTEEISQTAINPKNETADERSLRTYRVLKPGCTKFQARIIGEIPEEYKKYLDKAILHLRYFGSRRNRGFGKILAKEAPGDQQATTDKYEKFQSDKLQVTLTTKSPVVMSRQYGEQNTVATDLFVSGNRIRGLFADRFLNGNALNTDVRELFRNLFLSGNIQFGTLYPFAAPPLPLHIHELKSEKKWIDVFSVEGENSRPKRGFAKISEPNTDGKTIIEKHEPDTLFFFHNSRQKNRVAGRSTAEGADSIFYYQALDEDQKFIGYITGTTDLLDKLTERCGSQFTTYIGRSKSAQYGEVEIIISKPDSGSGNNASYKTETKNGIIRPEPDMDKEASATVNTNLFLLCLNSPLILLNTHGVPDPTGSVLIEYLKRHLPGATEIKIEKAAAEISFAEQFNVQWKSKTDKTPCFKEGSSFLIALENVKEENINVLVKYGLGEWKEQGLGQITLLHYKPLNNPVVIDHSPETSEPDNDQTTNNLTKDILQFINKKKEDIDIKSKAVEGATSFKNKPIKNHQASRMLGMIREADKQSTDTEKYKWITDYIKSLEGKPAYKTPELLGMVNSRKEIIFKRNKLFNKQENEWSFEKDKLYWTTQLNYIRKIKR